MNDDTSQHAGAIAHQSRTNFLYSFLILPKSQRRAIETVYAFCRVVDDVVDEEAASHDPRQELNHWRQEVAACFNGHAPHSPLARELKDILQTFPIPQDHFLTLIRGMEMDLDRRRYATFGELEEYCHHVAGVIGLMCIEIFGYGHASAHDYAVNLGKALQMVNIIRDLKEDAERGRIYLPQDDLARFNYSEADLHNQVYNENFLALMRCQAKRAREFRRRAKAALHPQDRKRMAASEIMANIYFALLNQIEKRKFNVFAHRPKLTKVEKAFLAMRAWLRVKL